MRCRYEFCLELGGDRKTGRGLVTDNALGDGRRGVTGAGMSLSDGGAGVDAALGAGEAGDLGSFLRSFGWSMPL